MGRLWEGMGMGGRGNDRWSRWQHSQPFTLNHYNHYYNYYFYNYQQSQAPPSSRGYEPFTLVRVAAMIVCYYLWWSEYPLQGLSIPWYMPTIDLSKYVLCHMVLDCMFADWLDSAEHHTQTPITILFQYCEYCEYFLHDHVCHILVC